jgi:hypothetical protein
MIEPRRAVRWRISMRSAYFLAALMLATWVGGSSAAAEDGLMQMAQMEAAAAPRSGPESVQKLAGKAAWDRIIGNSITGTENGKMLVEYYAADGTAKSMTDNQIATGNWTIGSDAICFKYRNVPRECYTLEVFGDTATFYNNKGEGGRYAIVKGNPHGL